MEFKDIVDVVTKLVGVFIAIPGAYLAFKRWFRPASLGVALDSVLFLGPGAQEDIKNDSIWIAAQMRFFNAGAMPESMIEIRVFELALTQHGEHCSFAPYALLKPLKLSSRKPGEAVQFYIEPKELSHSLVVKSEEQVVMHLLFIPDKGQRFEPRAGKITLRFDIKAKLAEEKVVEFPPLIRYREIDAEEAQELRQGKVAWLSWHLQTERIEIKPRKQN
jgi:hypothetical protein